MRANGRHARNWRGVRTALCLLLLLAASGWALWYFGYTLLTALVVALALGCLGAIVYGWWIGRRASRPVERAGTPGTRDA